MTISLELDLRSERILEHIGKATPKVMASAAKKAGVSALRKMKVETSRVIRSKKNLKVAKVKALIKGTVLGGSTIDKMGWRITVDGAAIPIGSFPMRQLKGGVKFKANKTTWSSYRGAFIATLSSGHRGAFRRSGNRPSRRKKYRDTRGQVNKSELPIRELHTSGASSAFKEQRSVERVLNAGSDEFGITFIRIIKAKL